MQEWNEALEGEANPTLDSDETCQQGQQNETEDLGNDRNGDHDSDGNDDEMPEMERADGNKDDNNSNDDNSDEENSNNKDDNNNDNENNTKKTIDELQQVMILARDHVDLCALVLVSKVRRCRVTRQSTR